MYSKFTKYSSVLLALVLYPVLLTAQQEIEVETDSLMLRGQTNYSSTFFKDRLLHNSLESFLDNYNDFLIYQTTTHGDFGTPDQTVLSIQGNSYRWNKYYLDGFRMDDRVRPGSYLYSQDLYSNSFNIDTYNSSFHFTKDKTIPNSALLRYNIGDIGGVTPGTEWFFNLFHSTALQTVYKPIDYRRNMKGQGVIMLDYNIEHKGKKLPQHLYVDFGQRELVAFDYTSGNSPFYENYLKSELSGALPTKENGFFNTLNYAMAFSFRDQLNHEFYYGENETSTDHEYSSSIYGTRLGDNTQLTTGLTFAAHVTKHNDLNFSRNHMDIDGESLDPYAPDANTMEISHSLNYKKALAERLTFNVETYNSLIHSKATTENYSNSVYFESLVNPYDNSWQVEDPFYTSLYIYDWESHSFSTGLLENSVGLSYEKDLSENLKLQSHINGTLDGILLNDKSIVKANWEADLFLNWTPNSHFSTSVNIGRKRVAFHYDMAKYLSNDYMDRDIYYWHDENEDRIYQDGEKSQELLTSTGGSYRTMADDIKQPAYFFVDWPLVVTVAKKHTFTLVTTYKKFYSQWQTVYDASDETYGEYIDDKYFLKEGANINYEINSNKPQGLQLGQSAEFLTNTPFSFTNVAKYAYNGEKAFFSISWVSQFMMNVTNLGNSPQENNIEMFSDLSANPNTQINQAGRPQQDRGYVARLLYGYKFNEHWKSSFLFKFIDGEPFSKYKVKLNTDENNNTQIATWREMPNSTSPLYDSWGMREDMGFNTEIRVAYTTRIKDASLEFNLSGYNLIDFAYELTSIGYDLPTVEGRRSIELCAPRGFMFTTKISF